MLAVFKSVYYVVLYAHSHRKPESIYALAPPPAPPLPGGGRAGAWATGELVTRQSPQYSLHAPPGGSRPRYSRNVVFPVLFKSCYYQYYKSLVFSLCSFESGDTVRAHLLNTAAHTDTNHCTRGS